MSLLGALLSTVVPIECVSSQSSARERRRRFTIRPRAGDEICRVQVDGCWLEDEAQQRVDYLFLGKSASGKKRVILVELKGGDFAKALNQIEATLKFLCKGQLGNVIHKGQHQGALAHEVPLNGGVQAYVILSQGHKVRLRQAKVESLRKRYNVHVYAYQGSRDFDGLDQLPG